MSCESFELDGFLRLNRAALSEFQAALRLLTASSTLQCQSTDQTGAAVGAIYVVPSAMGDVVGLVADRAMTIRGWDSPVPVWWRVLEGNATLHPSCGERNLRGGAFRSAPGALELDLDEGSRVVMVIPSARTPLTSEACVRSLSTAMVGRLIDQFLLQARFFLASEQAETGVRQLVSRLVELETTGQVRASLTFPGLDRRVMRAIELICRQQDWPFDLSGLASHAGASERNLYYLMKRETGVTPYRFYQHCRLVRVRRRLVDCRCEVPHISRYAADEGFSHLGRFAALYREHFGELPSETIQWRRGLLDKVAGKRAG